MDRGQIAVLALLLVALSSAIPQFPGEADHEPTTSQQPTPLPTAVPLGNGATDKLPNGNVVVSGTNCAARVDQPSGADQAAPSGAAVVVDVSSYHQIVSVDDSSGHKFGVSLCGTVDLLTCDAGPGQCATLAAFKKVTIGTFLDTGKGTQSGNQVTMNMSYPGTVLNTCGKASGALVQLTCGETLPCNCVDEVCVCPPQVAGCNDPLFPGRPFFHAYIASKCAVSDSTKAGFNIGTTEGGTDLAKNGMGAAATYDVAQGNTATIYLSLAGATTPLRYHEPQLSSADYTGGKVAISESGAADLGGTLTTAAAQTFTINFNCSGGESIVDVEVTVPIPPYDAVKFKISKTCASSLPVAPGAPTNVIARVSNDPALLGSVETAQLSWVVGTGTVTGYRVTPVLLETGSSANLAPRTYADPAATSATVKDLPPGRYKFKVAALNNASASVGSVSNSITLSNGDLVTQPLSSSPWGGSGGATPTPAPHRVEDLEEDEDEGSTSVLLLWFVCLWAMICVCGCVYKHNQGEQGLDMVPGSTVLYEIDDRFFDGKYTAEKRNSFKPLHQTEQGYGQAGVSSPRVPTKEQQFEIPSISSQGGNYQDL